MSTKDDVKWKLQIIFVYYTSYADRNNFRLLKQQNYRRFLIDSQTIKTQSALVHFDIAFQKINHSAIIFKDFLRLVPQIAQLVFKKSNRGQAFNQYIHRHIQPLFSEIIQKSEFGQDVNIAVNAKIDTQIQKKLMKITITERAYNQYIGSSMHGKQLFKVFQSLANFLKDFEVCPQIVSKSLVYVIFLYFMKEKHEHETFTVDDFVRSLIVIAQVGSRKITNIQLCSTGKIIKLLQRMQISAGFDQVSKKILYETAISPSFLRSFNQLNMQEDNCLQKLDKSASKLYPSSVRHKNCNESCELEHNSKDQLRTQNYQTVQRLIMNQNTSFSKDCKQIKSAFEDLCKYGEVANTKTLKSMKIKKLFQRIGLIPIVGQAWMDIQIVNLQRSSETGKIEFPQFLQLLSLVSKKIGASFEQITNSVLNDNKIITNYLNESSGYSRVHRAYTEQDEALLKQIIKCCQKQADKIYRKYSLDQPKMGFAQFSKLMYDFQIFPTIISKNKLYQIFTKLHDIRQQNIQTSSVSKRLSKGKDVQNYLKDNKKIDFSGFLMGLIEVGQQICDQSLESGQKLIVLLQKINQSQGYKKLRVPSLVGDIRKKFAQYYVKSFTQPEQHVQDFDQLLQNFS